MHRVQIWAQGMNQNMNQCPKMSFLGSGKHFGAFSVIFDEIRLKLRDFIAGGWYGCRKVILGLGYKLKYESMSRMGFLGSGKHSSNFSSENSSNY